MGRKRKSGEGTVRLRKDGRWEGRVVIGYDDKGLPKTKNVLAKTRADCVVKLGALKESVAPATAVKTRADMPFGEWVEFWYKNYSKELLIQEPKTKASIRTVILPPPVAEALRVYKQTVSSRWMFPSPKKEDVPLAPATASHRLSKILTHAGCKKVRFHDLRHVFATNALEHGMDVKTLSTIIGHVSSATTLNVYAHVTDDMQRQAATKIDRGIGRAETPTERSQATTSHAMTDFKPKRGKKRYWGSGYLGRTKGGRWNGRYTVTWPDGTKRTRDIYADSEDECEKLLAVMITEMKTEVAAEKERLRAESRAS